LVKECNLSFCSFWHLLLSYSTKISSKEREREREKEKERKREKIRSIMKKQGLVAAFLFFEYIII
jgi:hypothetical protein